MGFIAFIVFASVLALFVMKSVKGGKSYNNLVTLLNSQVGFNNDYSYVMADGYTIIGLDTSRRKICIIGKDLTPHILTKNDILKVEILLDNKTFHTSSFFTTWRNFLLVQAITGNKELAELEGRRKIEVIDKMITVQLLVATRNLNYSNHYLAFLINGNAKQKKDVLKDVYDWATKIEAL